MIPDITLPVYNLGPIPIDPWGTLVCIGFVLGLEVARARGLRLGLDVRDVVDSVVCIVLTGFVVGHLVHVLAYHPEQMERDG
ncbi:MAG TPA: prolipoprotein diacylglyceryl transferase, partial [Myxococcota bacterium]|nr:prolipoprotein diacylglyceryl transferase [Myxococcota bacterium]